jgi:putative ABC transport system ATP-binding protein
MNNVIEANGIVKDYILGESVVHALKGVSFAIGEGETVAISGPSGSGKSTLMNILGCLAKPDQGDYILSGRNVAQLTGNDLAAIRNRHIGFVFQSFNLLARMTALENVELPLLYAGARDSRAQAIKALNTVGLADRMTHEPNRLSGGQRQRVAIARAIVTNPSILLADEPTGNLDTRTGTEIIALFHELNAQGRTIIMVTHDPDVAAQCQRQIHVRDGHIVDPVTLEAR